MPKRKTHDDFILEVYSLVGYEYLILGKYKNAKSKINVKHTVCGHEYEIIPDKFLRGRRCPICNDGISYPEKFILNLLKQIKIEFEYQKRFTWSKNVKNENTVLSGTKIYDFYIPYLNCIIETHGEQHYTKKFNGKQLNFVKVNDQFKENLAKNNGIENYIIIDCRNSELKHMKNNIINSKLNQLFDLSNINWLECHKFACSSMIKKICELWNGGVKSTSKIGEELKIHKTTVIKYLKQGDKFNLCVYNSKRNMVSNGLINGFQKKEIVRLTKNNIFIDKFASITEAQDKLNVNHISDVCKGKRKTAGGYKWMYKEDYDKYITNQNKELTLT